MSLLLDTHVLLWWLDGDSRLTEPARSRIAAEPLVFVSAASAWEISVKRTLGKLRFDADLETEMDVEGFRPLPVTLAHGTVAGSLDLHHRDPFDRMLVAQARCEGLTLVSADEWVGKYEVDVLPVT